MAALAVSILLVMVVGFAAHRASVCMVKSVAEVFTSGRAYMMVSFVKTVAWVIAIATPLAWLASPPAFEIPSFPLHAGVLLGGFVFGIGAAVNGGCSISTATRLGGGDLRMLATLAGLSLGILALIAAPAPVDSLIRAPITVGSPLTEPGLLALALLAPLWAWVVIESVDLWKRRTETGGLRGLIFSPRWSLSAAAAFMGLAAAVLCLLQGAWMYGGTLRDAAVAIVQRTEAPRLGLWLFLLALVAGAGVSAWLRGTFRLSVPSAIPASRHGFGGFLMGFGAAAIPGGNAAVLMHGLPILSPHAALALLGMLIGIAATFLLVRSAGGKLPLVDCHGDICRSS